MSEEIKDIGEKDEQAFHSMYKITSIDELNWKLGDPRITVIGCAAFLILVGLSRFGYFYMPAFMMPTNGFFIPIIAIVIGFVAYSLIFGSLFEGGLSSQFKIQEEKLFAEMTHFTYLTYTVNRSIRFNAYTLIACVVSFGLIQNTTVDNVFFVADYILALASFLLIYVIYSLWLTNASRAIDQQPLDYVEIKFSENLFAVGFSLLMAFLILAVGDLSPANSTDFLAVLLVGIAISDALQTRKVRNQLSEQKSTEMHA